MANVISIPETVKSINEDYATPRSNLSYPYLRILDISDALALIVPSLPAGKLQLVMTYKGVTRVVGQISSSALCIAKLIKLSRLEFVRDKNDVTLLTTGKDILELGVI